MIHLLACLALSAPTPMSAPNTQPAAVVRLADAYADLLAEYEAAVTTWKATLDGTDDRALRSELRNSPPSEAFATRFEALAAAGEGRALVWQIENIRKINIAARARESKRLEWYGILFDQHVSQPWFGDALTQLWGDRKRCEQDQLGAWLQAARDGNESKEVQAQARYYLAYDAVNSEDKATRERGFAAFDALIAELPDAEWSNRARQDLFLMRDRVVGKPALDFEAKTVDGVSFKLSDYRGKVVLLDFWGFW